VETTRATGVPIFFCNPGSPWQRGSNENTNGLLRQYFPKGTDLNAHSAQRLLEVATELNERPRKPLKRNTPGNLLSELVSKKEIASVFHRLKPPRDTRR
jgi:IS30 family transposase